MVTVAELDALIRLRLEGEQNARRAQKALDDVEKSGSGLGKTLASVGKVAATAFVGLGVGAAAGLAGAVKTAADFQQSLADVGAATGATEAQMKSMRAEALKIGADTSKSASEAVLAMSDLVKSGVSVEDTVGGVARTVVQLSEATGSSVSGMATLMSDSLNVFNLEASESANVANTLSRAAGASSIDINDMAQSLASGGLVAKNAGLSIDDFATSIAILGNQGLKGSDAGTSLKAVIAGLTPTTDKAKAAFQNLGIEVFDAQGNFKAFPDVLANLSQAFSGLTQEQRASTAELLFGSDGIRAFNALVPDTASGLQSATQQWENMTEAQRQQATVAEQSARRLATFKGQIEALKGTLETIAIEIGSAFLPGLTRMTTFLATNLPQAFAAAQAAFAAFRTMLSGGGTGEMTNLLSTFLPPDMAAKVAAAMQAIVSAVQAAIPQIVAAFQNLGPIALVALQGIMTAIQPLIPIITTFGSLVAQHFGTIGPIIITAVAAFMTLSPIVGVIASVIASVSGMAAAFGAMSAAVGPVAAIVAILGGPLTLAIIAVSAAIALMVVAWTQNWGDIQGKTETAINVIKAAIDGLKAAFAAVGDFLQPLIDRVREFGDLIGPEIEGAISAITGAFASLGDRITGDVQAAFNAVAPVVQAALEPIVGFVQAHGDQIRTIFQSAWDAISALVNGAIGVISNVIQAALNAIQGDWSGVWQNLQNIVSIWASTVQAVVQAAMTALKAALQIVIDALQAAWPAAWTAAKTALDILINAIPGARATIQTIQTVITAVGTAASAAAGFVRSLASGISSAASAAGDAVGKLKGVADALSAVGSTIGKLGAVLPGSLPPLAQGFKDTGEQATIAAGGLGMMASALQDAGQFGTSTLSTWARSTATLVDYSTQLRHANADLRELNAELRQLKLAQALDPTNEAIGEQIKGLTFTVNVQKDLAAVLKESIAGWHAETFAVDGFVQSLNTLNQAGPQALKIQEAFIKALTENDFSAGGNLAESIHKMIADATKTLTDAPELLEPIRQFGQQVLNQFQLALSDPTETHIDTAMLMLGYLTDAINQATAAHATQIKAAGTLTAETFAQAFAGEESKAALGSAGVSLMEALADAMNQGGQKAIEKAANLTQGMQDELQKLPEFVRGKLGADFKSALDAFLQNPTQEALNELRPIIQQINQTIDLIPQNMSDLAPEVVSEIEQIIQAFIDMGLTAEEAAGKIDEALKRAAARAKESSAAIKSALSPEQEAKLTEHITGLGVPKQFIAPAGGGGGGQNAKAEMFAAAVASPGGWTPALAAAFAEGMNQIADAMAAETAAIENETRQREYLRQLSLQAGHTAGPARVNAVLTDLSSGFISIEEAIRELLALLRQRAEQPIQTNLYIDGRELATVTTPYISQTIAATVSATMGGG